MPFAPGVEFGSFTSPSKSMCLRYITSAAAPLKLMPLPDATSTPAVTPGQEIVMDLMLVTAPKPAGSRQLISPPAAVLEIAPAKVLQGAVRLHGLASSPTPDTQVRVAWAWAGADASTGARNRMANASRAMRRIINLPNWPGGPGL